MNYPVWLWYSRKCFYQMIKMFIYRTLKWMNWTHYRALTIHLMYIFIIWIGIQTSVVQRYLLWLLDKLVAYYFVRQIKRATICFIQKETHLKLPYSAFHRVDHVELSTFLQYLCDVITMNQTVTYLLQNSSTVVVFTLWMHRNRHIVDKMKVWSMRVNLSWGRYDLTQMNEHRARQK